MSGVVNTPSRTGSMGGAVHVPSFEQQRRMQTRPLPSGIHPNLPGEQPEDLPDTSPPASRRNRACGRTRRAASRPSCDTSRLVRKTTTSAGGRHDREDLPSDLLPRFVRPGPLGEGSYATSRSSP
jgi:hypothetical protein